MLRMLLTAGGVLLGLGCAFLLYWLYCGISYGRRQKGIAWHATGFVIGSSMEPTLHEGDFLHYRRVTRWHKFQVGGIYAFWDPRNEGHDYISNKMFIKRLDKIMPDGTLYFLGDNRSNSFDSRNFGSVPREVVRYKVRGWTRRQAIAIGGLRGRLFRFIAKNADDDGQIQMVDGAGNPNIPTAKKKKKRYKPPKRGHKR